MNEVGFVSFIGAGPGDEGLITVKAMKRLEQADVILYDRLINPLLLEYCNRSAELVYCGKLPDRHLLRQEAINDLLVQYAVNGKKVVRLKGGDPGVFGRVGEEVAALEQHSCAYEIIPGITSGIGAPLYAGIPVTHRDVSTSFAIVTGHSQQGSSTINWEALASGVDTLVFYMGIKNLSEIKDKLMEYGRDPNEPVKIIQWGTLNKQRTITATLATVVQEVEKEKISNPAITLVGQVAGLETGVRSWFESRPLFGQHVLLAKSSNHQGELSEQLKDYGAEIFQYPRWNIEELPFPENVNPTEFQQITFEAAASVHWFFKWLQHEKLDIRHINAKLFGTTKSAKEALIDKGLIACESIEFISEVKSLMLGLDKQEKVELADTCVSTHIQRPYKQSTQTLKRMIEEQRIETIVFPNAKSVLSMINGLKELGLEPRDLVQTKQVICYGTHSKAAAENAGFIVSHTLARPEPELLVQWLIAAKKEVKLS